MKRIILSIFIVILTGFVLVMSFNYIKNFNKPDTETNVKGKEISQQEYIYKEDLLHIGYKMNEINTIEKKISTVNVKKYLLKEKYNNLLNFIYVPYFNCSNIQRYEKYYKENNNSTYEESVLNVEMNLDRDYYTNIEEITNYDEVTTLVNKFYKLPNNYEATDLVTLDKKYGDNQKLKNIAAIKVKELMDDAEKENIKLTIISSYRTEAKQESLFNTTKKNKGLTHALKYQAKPGHSEHQTGYALDFNTTKESFAKTKQYKWLQENAYKYGFIERYPKNKTEITGYGYEPWHYRYVGIDVSTKIHEENITLEEYLIKYK